MKRIYIILAAVLGFHLFFLSKLQFTVWPEMLSFPYMADKGFLIYRDFHHVYQPLMTFLLLGYYKIFGFSPESLKIFSWVLIMFIDILVFAVSNQLFKNKWLSLVPLSLYVLLQPLFEGNMMWYDIAMTVPMLLTVHFILKWSPKKRWQDIFLSGLFLAVSCLIKQQAVLAAIPVFIYLLSKKLSFKEFWILTAGGLIPLLLTMFFLLVTGDFNDYIFWTFQFPLFWLPKFPGYKVLPVKKELLIIALMVLTPIPGIIKGIFSKKSDSNMLLVYGIFLTSLVSAFPRFSFFHLQPFLAFFTISVTSLIIQKNEAPQPNGRGIFSRASSGAESPRSENSSLIRGLTLGVFAKGDKLFLFFAVAALSYILFYRWRIVLPEFNGSMRFYGNEEKSISGYLDKNTLPTDKVYLLGPHSAIYVYSGRIPPKPWIESYVWHFEIPGLQEKVISGWESDPPKVILWTDPVPGNWFDLGTYQPKKISEWIKKNYTEKEKIESNIGVWYRKIK